VIKVLKIVKFLGQKWGKSGAKVGQNSIRTRKTARKLLRNDNFFGAKVGQKWGKSGAKVGQNFRNKS